MSKIAPTNDTIYLSRDGDLRPGETRQDECIRALFLTTIVLGTCLLVAACYHLPPNVALGGTGLGVIFVSMAAIHIHNNRVDKRLLAKVSSKTVKVTTLSVEDLTKLPPAKIKARINRMTSEEKKVTCALLNTYFAKPGEAKISRDVAEILILGLGLGRRQVSRTVKSDELSAYETHELLTLSPEEMIEKIDEMSLEEIAEACEHVEENLKTMRVPVEAGYVLVDRLGVDVTLVQDAEDSLCTRPYSLLEMGFQEIDQMMTVTPMQVEKVLKKGFTKIRTAETPKEEQMTWLYAQMTPEQKKKALAFVDEKLGGRSITPAAHELFAVAFMMDPNFAEIWIKATLSAKTPPLPPKSLPVKKPSLPPPHAAEIRGHCGNEIPKGPWLTCIEPGMITG